MSRPLAFATLATLATVVAAALAQPSAPAPRLRDRIVAVVDEDPILLSDVERVISLGLVQRRAGESEEGLRRRVLDGLIAQRLRYHEVDRYGFASIPLATIEEQVAAIREGFGSPAEFAATLAELGMTEDDLRLLIGRQLEVLVYVEELLGARVFVGLEEIEEHYHQELAPRLEAAGEPVPPLPEIRESIRQVLRERRLNEELERWTEELRREADVIDLLERPVRPLPPVSPFDPDGGSIKLRIPLHHPLHTVDPEPRGAAADLAVELGRLL